MSLARTAEQNPVLVLGLVAGLVLLLLANKAAGAAGNALGKLSDAAGAGFDAISSTGAAADAAIADTVGAVGAVVGLPSPSMLTDNPRVARYLIDMYGRLEASFWSTVPALLSAMNMPAGSGTPPAPGTAVYDAFFANRARGGGGSW